MFSNISTRFFLQQSIFFISFLLVSHITCYSSLLHLLISHASWTKLTYSISVVILSLVVTTKWNQTPLEKLCAFLTPCRNNKIKKAREEKSKESQHPTEKIVKTFEASSAKDIVSNLIFFLNFGQFYRKIGPTGKKLYRHVDEVVWVRFSGEIISRNRCWLERRANICRSFSLSRPWNLNWWSLNFFFQSLAWPWVLFVS